MVGRAAVGNPWIFSGINKDRPQPRRNLRNNQTSLAVDDRFLRMEDANQ